VTTLARAIVFGAASLILAYVSRASLRSPASHGFSRFLAWETILALFVLNVTVWFRDWLSWHQILSWILLTFSLVPLVMGVKSLRSYGKPDRTKRTETHLLDFERTTGLVTQGIFRHIRHPLYSSLLLLAWGVFFKTPSVPGGVLALLSTVFLVITARRDEAECLEVFGQEYDAYMRRTRMFIPRVF
jgi:protein-S-isoprenylcysteine O-methyltransferase Ste14